MLLEHGARVNEPITERDNDTPLLAAIPYARDPGLVRLLIENGASTTMSNGKGDTAASLANELFNPAIKKALLPSSEQTSWRPELEDFIISGALFANAYIGDSGKVLGNVLNRLPSLLNAFPSSQNVGSCKTNGCIRTYHGNRND